MKRIAPLCSLLMAVMLLVACAGPAGEDSLQEKKSVQGSGGTPDKAAAASAAEPTQEQAPAAEAVVLKDVAYVMVYNPLLYDEATDVANYQYSGKLGDQIGTEMTRDDEDAPEMPVSIAQNEWGALDVSNVDPSALSRAEESAVAFKLADKNVFYTMGDDASSFAPKDFECVAVGENCNVWVNEGCIDAATAEAAASELDRTVYRVDTELFGEGRFMDNGGKLNILVYDLGGEGLCGFFRPAELFTEEEAEAGGVMPTNTDMATIHVNSRLCTEDKVQMLYGTIAHEYQHLINFSQTMRMFLLSGGSVFGMMGTWLNESMSMYAEDACYAGMVEESGYVRFAYNRSPAIAGGNSLYNFDVQGGDVGVYGQAYLFSKYIERQCGADAMTRIHAYWGGACGDKPYTAAGALYDSVTDEMRDSISAVATYSPELEGMLGSKENVWLSKLGLSFHIACLINEDDGVYSVGSAADEVGPKAFADEEGTDIQGGGRLFLITQDGSYTIPAQASPGLIYVGFDSEGSIVVPPTTAGEYRG